MDTCADIACICGEHECVHKFRRNAVKPHVYKPGLPQTEAQEKYCGHYNVERQKPLKPYCLKWRELDLEPNIIEEQKVELHNTEPGGRTICCNPCRHGDYIPRASGYKPQISSQCMPDVEVVKEMSKLDDCKSFEGKECKTCDDIFSVDWKKESPQPDQDERNFCFQRSNDYVPVDRCIQGRTGCVRECYQKCGCPKINKGLSLMHNKCYQLEKTPNFRNIQYLDPCETECCRDRICPKRKQETGGICYQTKHSKDPGCLEGDYDQESICIQKQCHQNKVGSSCEDDLNFGGKSIDSRVTCYQSKNCAGREYNCHQNCKCCQCMDSDDNNYKGNNLMAKYGGNERNAGLSCQYQRTHANVDTRLTTDLLRNTGAGHYELNCCKRCHQ